MSIPLGVKKIGLVSVTGQITLLMRGNAIMLSSRSPDQDIPVPEIDGVL